MRQIVVEGCLSCTEIWQNCGIAPPVITHANRNVPAQVIGLNVPQPKAYIYIEPGNNSQAMPPKRSYTAERLELAG